jgi:hypothetical protein
MYCSGSEPLLVDVPLGLVVGRHVPPLSDDFSLIVYYKNDINFKQTLLNTVNTRC